MYTNMMTDWQDFARRFSNIGQNPWADAGNAWRGWTPNYAATATLGVNSMVKQAAELPLSYATIALEQAHVMAAGQSWCVGWARQLTEGYLTWLGFQEQAWDWCFTAGTATVTETGSARAQRSAEPARKVPAARPQVELELSTKERKTAKPAPRVAKLAARRDDLKRISGIGPGLEKKLNAEGICSFEQIASLKKSDITRLERNVVKFPGRIQRDKWVEQARKLR